MVLRLCENVNFKAGVSYHPSHSRICELLEESEEELLKNVKCPQIFMPADGDHANNFPNGLGILKLLIHIYFSKTYEELYFQKTGKKVLDDVLEVVTFPDMKHGWVTRGDMSDSKVERDVQKGINLALSFFAKYMK